MPLCLKLAMDASAPASGGTSDATAPALGIAHQPPLNCAEQDCEPLPPKRPLQHHKVVRPAHCGSHIPKPASRARRAHVTHQASTARATGTCHIAAVARSMHSSASAVPSPARQWCTQRSQSLGNAASLRLPHTSAVLTAAQGVHSGARMPDCERAAAPCSNDGCLQRQTPAARMPECSPAPGIHASLSVDTCTLPELCDAARPHDDDDPSATAYGRPSPGVDALAAAPLAPISTASAFAALPGLRPLVPVRTHPTVSAQARLASPANNTACLLPSASTCSAGSDHEADGESVPVPARPADRVKGSQAQRASAACSEPAAAGEQAARAGSLGAQHGSERGPLCQPAALVAGWREWWAALPGAGVGSPPGATFSHDSECLARGWDPDARHKIDCLFDSLDAEDAVVRWLSMWLLQQWRLANHVVTTLSTQGTPLRWLR